MSYFRTTCARSTGLPVTVGTAEALGLDPEDGACKWYTQCDEHGGICGHETLALARSWASEPETWCPTCSEGQ